MLQLILIYIAQLWHSESSVLLLTVCDVWVPTPSVADFWNTQCHSSCTAGLWDTEFMLLTFTGKCLALYDIRNLNWSIKCALFLFFIYLKHYDWIASNLKSIQKKTLPAFGINSNLLFSSFVGKEMRYDKKNVLLWGLHRAAAAQMSWTPLTCICIAAGPHFQASPEGVLLSVTRCALT